MIDWDLQPTYRQIKQILQPSIKVESGRSSHAALFNNKGQLIHVAGPIPLHYFGFSQTIQNVQKYFKLQPDDVIISNDPAFGSPRLCDINFIKAIYSNSDLRGFVVYQLTHEGLLNSKNIINPKTIDDEGFKIPPTPLDKKGEIKAALLHYLAESKIPAPALDQAFTEALEGLDQVSQRFLNLEKKWGKTFLQDKIQSLEKYTESIFQKSLHHFPDGDFSVTAKMGKETIATNLRVREKTFIIDFAGTSKQGATTVQCHYNVTLSACFWFFLSVLGEEIPINEGCLRALSVEAPIGSLVNPTGQYAALLGYYEISQAICHNLFKILQKTIPRAAETYQFQDTVSFLVQSPTGTFVETLGCGQSATQLKEGFSAIKMDWNNLPNRSAETLESQCHLSVNSFGLNLRAEKTFQKKGGLGAHLKFSPQPGSKVKLLTENATALEAKVAPDKVTISTFNGMDWGAKESEDS